MLVSLYSRAYLCTLSHIIEDSPVAMQIEIPIISYKQCSNLAQSSEVAKGLRSISHVLCASRC
jgi:hypothetical protein